MNQYWRDLTIGNVLADVMKFREHFMVRQVQTKIENYAKVLDEVWTIPKKISYQPNGSR